jgi:hypothetical protein
VALLLRVKCCFEIKALTLLWETNQRATRQGKLVPKVVRPRPKTKKKTNQPLGKSTHKTPCRVHPNVGVVLEAPQNGGNLPADNYSPN